MLKRDFILLHLCSSRSYNLFYVFINYIYSGYYRFLFSLVSLRLFLYLKNIHWVHKYLIVYKRDQETLRHHWIKDKYLILLTNVCRFLYVSGFLFIFYSLYICKTLNVTERVSIGIKKGWVI